MSSCSLPPGRWPKTSLHTLSSKAMTVLQWQHCCWATPGGEPAVPAVHQHLLYRQFVVCFDAKSPTLAYTRSAESVGTWTLVGEVWQLVCRCVVVCRSQRGRWLFTVLQMIWHLKCKWHAWAEWQDLSFVMASCCFCQKQAKLLFFSC